MISVMVQLLIWVFLLSWFGITQLDSFFARKAGLDVVVSPIRVRKFNSGYAPVLAGALVFLMKVFG
jgi:hypothetical protein